MKGYFVITLREVLLMLLWINWDCQKKGDFDSRRSKHAHVFVSVWKMGFNPALWWLLGLEAWRGNGVKISSWDIFTQCSLSHLSLSLPLSPSCLILPLCLHHPISTAKFMLTSSRLLRNTPSARLCFCSIAPSTFLFFFLSIACVLSSVDVIIWAFVFVWQVSRAFYLRHFHFIFTTQTHTHMHAPTDEDTLTLTHGATWEARCSVMCC